MATDRKTTAKFAEMAKEAPRRTKGARQNSNSQSKNFNIMEGSNKKLLAEAAKVDAQQENAPTILEAHNRGKAANISAENSSEKNSPENSSEILCEKSIKDFATELFDDFKTIAMAEITLEALKYALIRTYGAQNGHFLYYGFNRDTKGGRLTYVNTIDATINDAQKIEIKVTKGATVTIYTYYLIDTKERPVTVASIMARFNSWYNFGKRTNSPYIRPIIAISAEKAKEAKAAKVVDEMDENKLFALFAAKLGISVDDLKALKKG